MTRLSADRPRGVTPAEVLIVIAIVGLLILLALMAVPRSRENARLLSCERNLAQIGQAVIYYDGALGHLPITPRAGQAGMGPLGAVLGEFGLDAFAIRADPAKASLKRVGGADSEHVVPTFLCPSDVASHDSRFPAPVSYRADAGSRTDGSDGPFAFGRVTRIAEAEFAAGQDFTAGFSERLLGSGSDPASPVNDYQRVTGRVSAEACPLDAGAWRTDAGSSWARGDWMNSLYSHALTPNASPSCIADDGATARMGASSAHPRRVNVLMLGGSVRGFTPDVDPEVWRKFGAISEKDRATKPEP